MTELSMNRQWRDRFETELTKARNVLSKKVVRRPMTKW